MNVRSIRPRRGMTWCAAAVVYCVLATAMPAPGTASAKGSTFVIAESTFDADAEGWTLVGEAQGPNWQATGGNPDGYVSATDPPSTTGTSYWRAPGAFLGDVSAAFGQKLRFELRDAGPGNTFRDSDVVLVGGPTTLVYRQKGVPKTKRFKRFSVKLARGKRWTDASTGLKATTEQMQSVLSSLDTLLIRGEFRNGPETFDLDNVVLRGRTQ